ncbi:MAG TPA: GH25 family lysozyme, partial [Polyangiaceae bacterium]|nr:GH25 family lysozyme [Polyangiaceae bacterium]
VRGAYHFAHPGRDPETQAVHFASTVGPLGFNDLPPVLDIEEDDGQKAADVIVWVRRFLGKAEALFGRKLIVYTGAFWRGPLGNPKDSFFAERPLWLAAYVSNPVVPGAWSRSTFWQYTQGTLNGAVDIGGVRPCDQNRFEGSEADLAALCQGTVPAPPGPVPASPGATPAWPGTFFVFPHTPAFSGEAVKQLQTRLVSLGFTLEVDGAYGPQSKAACMAFQKDRGLSADGIVGRATWDACFAS